MNDFKKSGGFGGNRNRHGFNAGGGRSNFSGRPDFKHSRNRDGHHSQMFTATCDECHKTCEVPFRPNGGKPVYCRECFSIKRESLNGNFPRREAPSRGFSKRDFTPSFSAKAQGEDRRIDELKRQVDAINVKIDRLLQMAERTVPAQAAPAAVKQAEKKVAAAASGKAAANPKKGQKKVTANLKKKPAKKKK